MSLSVWVSCQPLVSNVLKSPDPAPQFGVALVSNEASAKRSWPSRG